MIFRREDGAYRLYLYNDCRHRYRRAFVVSQFDVKEVKVVSKFPILPPRYLDEPKDTYRHNFDAPVTDKKKFEVIIHPLVSQL